MSHLYQLTVSPYKVQGKKYVTTHNISHMYIQCPMEVSYFYQKESLLITFFKLTVILIGDRLLFYLQTNKKKEALYLIVITLCLFLKNIYDKRH